MTLSHDQVLQFVKQRGPCVPNDIRQALKAQDNFIVGAILSELTNQGKLRTTNFSLGTSKFYYDPDHPELLEGVAKHLNEKNERAFQLIKTNQVLKNADLEPIMRVALVNTPDYATSLRLQTPSGEELFWRYYLFSEQDAVERIKELFFGQKTKLQEEKQKIESQEEKKLPETPAQPSQEIRFGKKLPLEKAEEKKIEKSPQVTPPKTETNPQKTPQPKQKRIPKTKDTATILSQGFAKQVHEYFDTKHIGFLEVIKATKSELTCLVSIPSAVGNVTYFCKAKSKKTTNDGDLASALLESQQHKLPLLYVASGTLSKKAQELQATQLKGAVVVTPWA